MTTLAPELEDTELSTPTVEDKSPDVDTPEDSPQVIEEAAAEARRRGDALYQTAEELEAEAAAQVRGTGPEGASDTTVSVDSEASTEPVLTQEQAAVVYKDKNPGAIEDPLKAQLEAENEDNWRTSVKNDQRDAQKYKDLPGGEDTATFNGRAAFGFAQSAERNAADINRSTEAIGADYDKIKDLVDGIRERAALATTPYELDAQKKMEEHLANALYNANVTNENRVGNGVSSMYNFIKDPDIRAAQGYAAQAGDSHRTPEQLHDLLVAHGAEEQ